MPCGELCDQQPREYRESVLPSSVPARLAVEAGSPQGWHRYVGDRGDVLGVDRFGASALGSEMLERYGFTVHNVCPRVRITEERGGGHESVGPCRSGCE